MMKLLPLICYLILLLVSNAESRSVPGILKTDTHGDTIIHCEVYFDILTRIQIFDDYVRGRNDEPAGSSAIFTGGFGILEIYQNSVILLNLSSNSNNKSVITEIDDIDVEAQWEDGDQVLTTRIHRENQGIIASHEEYEVKVRSVKGLKDKVIISVAAHGQRVEIDVNYEPAEKAISKAMDVFLHVCLIIFVVLFICIYTWSSFV